MKKFEIGDFCEGLYCSHPGRVSYTLVGVLTQVNLVTLAIDWSALISCGKSLSSSVKVACRISSSDFVSQPAAGAKTSSSIEQSFEAYPLHVSLMSAYTESNLLRLKMRLSTVESFRSNHKCKFITGTPRKWTKSSKYGMPLHSGGHSFLTASTGIAFTYASAEMTSFPLSSRPATDLSSLTSTRVTGESVRTMPPLLSM